jgi:hypothetical protein
MFVRLVHVRAVDPQIARSAQRQVPDSCVVANPETELL